jgi:hypothetical protein
MGIFRNTQPGQPRYSGELHNLQVTESIFGTCVPIVFGTTRVHGKLLFYGGFNAQKAKNSAGKGIFGGKATQFIYYADNLQCLGQGSSSDVCKGVINIWDQNGRLANQNTSYDYLIESPYTIQPSINPGITASLGVYQPNVPTSVSTDNFGSGNPSGSSTVVTQNVAFDDTPGAPQGSGQYTFNPSTGTYTFHPSDAGKTVTIVYSTVFSIYYDVTLQAAAIPQGQIPPRITADNEQYFYQDQGVVFVDTGAALTRDSDDSENEPGQSGHYNVKTGSPGEANSGGFYTFNRADAGRFVYIRYSFTSSDSELTNTSSLNITFFSGALSQAPWSYIQSKYPGQQLGYNAVAYVGFNPMYLGGSALVQPYNYELSGLELFGGGTLDAHPLDAFFSMLVDPLIGAGFPVQDLDGCLPFTTDTNAPSSAAQWGAPWQAVIGQQFAGALKTQARDTLTAAVPVPENTFPIYAGQKIFISGWLNSLGLAGHPNDGNVWTLTLGVQVTFAGGTNNWYSVDSIPAGQDWTYKFGYFTVPQGAVALEGWVQIGATPGAIAPYYGLFAMPTFSTMMPKSWLDAYSYWAANNYLISKSIDTQSAVSEIFREVIDVGNVGAVFSGGILKLVPYGDTSAVGNGYVYIPPHTTGAPPPTLTWDDLITTSKPGEKRSDDPIEVTQKAAQDCLNYVQCQYTNRENDYNNELIPLQNDAFIATYGFRPEASQTWDFVTTHQTAAWALGLRLKRNTYIRNTYKFRLSFYWSQMEPMDMLVLPTSEPVRITQIEEDADGMMQVEAEQWSYGTANVTVYPVQQPTSFLPIYSQSLPGDTHPVIFEATPQSVLARPNTIQIAVAGDNPQWGGCEIFVSQDGNEYVPVGNMDSLGRVGLITNTVAIGSDPDTVNTLSVDMTASEAELVTVTQPQANQFASLCALTNTGGAVELVSYETSTETALNRYNLTYLRRGVYGTTIGTWYAGDEFSYLGINGVFEYQYPSQYVGKTIYFKFTSYNMAHLQQQDLANVRAWPYVVLGTSLQPPSSGTFHTQPPILVSAQATTTTPSVVGFVGAVTAYAWNDSPHSGPVGSYIWKNPNDTASWGTPRSTSNATSVVSGSSMMFDVNFASYPGHGGPGDPVLWTTLNTAGQVTGTTPLFPAGPPESAGYSDFNAAIVATLNIPAAGTYTFTLNNKDQVMIGVGGGATVSTGFVTNPGFGQTMTAINGLPLVFVSTADGSGAYHTSQIIMTFPGPGSYPLEINWNYWFHSTRTMTFFLGTNTNIGPVPTGGGTIGQVTIQNFLALFNNQQVACTPTPNIIQNLVRGQTYYVYYIDRAFQGGNIVPYITQNILDFLGVTGFHQLLGPNADGSVTIPTQAGTTLLRSGPGSNPLRMFQTFSVGSTTAILPPLLALDGNPSTACYLRGFVQDTDVFFCEVQFWGPAGRSSPSATTLFVDCSLSGGDVFVDLIVGAVPVQQIVTPNARQIFSIPIPAGTDFGSVEVVAHAGGATGQPDAEVYVYDIYIQ